MSVLLSLFLFVTFICVMFSVFFKAEVVFSGVFD